MSKPLNICVSGSGIAGSVFAWWLLRAYRNANITIVERAPALRLTGASVDIRSSAVDIIKRMGVEPEIRKYTTQEEGIQWVKANGKPIATIRASGRSDIQTITSEYEIHRGQLARIFIEPVLDRVKLVFNEYVESYVDRPYGIDVTFANSKETKTFDLLVAADGTGSRIRGMMLGTKPREQFHDEGMHVAYWTANKDLLKGSRLAKWHNDTGGRALFLRPDPDPAGKTRAMFMNITTSNMNDKKERLDQAIKEGNESYMKLMEEEFKDAGWLAPEALKTMRETDDFYCSIFGQVRSPKIHTGRLVLLGDAGYATPGLGTSLAIMGGYVLAGELLRHAGDVEAAGKAYEDLLKPFVKGQQGNDNAMQYLNPQTALGIQVRDLLLATLTGLRIDRLALSIAALLGIKESQLDLPEYSWPAEYES